MKKDLRVLLAVALLLAGLAKTAAAQEPTPEKIPVAPAAPAVVAPAPADCAPPCDPCCVPTKKICVPKPHKKTHTHVEYSSKCEDFCLPKCSCLFSLFGKKKDYGCCDGGCSECDLKCGKVRQRKKLVKKFHKEEHEELRCEPEEVPCEIPCHPCENPCPVPCPAPCEVVLPATPPPAK